MNKRLGWIVVALAIVGAGCVLAWPSFKVSAKQVINAAVQGPLKLHDRNIRYQMDLIACEQTAHFVMENLPKARAFDDKFQLLSYSLDAVDDQRSGLYCEFGVYTGSTINHIASKTEQTIHGFDSFEGLPEDWRTGVAKGYFEVNGLPKVRANVKLHKGWFNESLPVWAEEYSGPIVFMHLDADLYSSTKTIFEVLGDRVVPGTVLQFDEYFNYPGWQQGEFKAFKEFVEARQITFEYLGYCSRDEQVAVRILTVSASAEASPVPLSAASANQAPRD